jgi:phosphoribosylglycinamide formyltransferase-1
VVASTSGSVMSKALNLDDIKKSIYMVISDRECGAIDLARQFGIKTAILTSNTGKQFSDKLLDYFKDDEIDIFISFYSRIFSANFLREYNNKVYNFHPSLLPACKGKDGFGQTLRSGTKYMGSTLHLVDEGIDTGEPVVQSISIIDPNISTIENRHIIFVQQCKIFIQFILWVNEGRVLAGTIKDASYSFDNFAPNLEHSSAIDFNVELSH